MSIWRKYHRCNTDIDTLRDELADVRSHGITENHEESIQGLGVGAPIRDQDGKLYGAVSETGPVSRLGDDVLEEESTGLIRRAVNIASLTLNSSVRYYLTDETPSSDWSSSAVGQRCPLMSRIGETIPIYVDSDAGVGRGPSLYSRETEQMPRTNSRILHRATAVTLLPALLNRFPSDTAGDGHNLMDLNNTFLKYVL
ncbi:IclR family transcriptional regulator domain-containing protein [Natrinema halophilum]|uniref:IclR family transcriptional regulator domain-containing protein n=1 Tax=Natrinema halophilum TaxID=1699371 RepID=UPI0024DF13F2|nr:IclR family transcriptional regulator C-terminal domain-containing protein [Natrinema halophilum]